MSTYIPGRTDFFVCPGGDNRNSGSSDTPPVIVTSRVNPSSPNVVVDFNGGGWGGAEVDAWLCWDVDGVRERARIVQISGDLATVDRNLMTDGSNKTSRVGDPLATIQHALDFINTTHVNAAGDPPFVNVQVGTYVESPAMIVSGTAETPITVEGYSQSPGDLRGTATRATIAPESIPGAAAISVSGAYVILRNLDADGLDKVGIDVTSPRVSILNCRSRGDQTAVNLHGANYTNVTDCEFYDSGSEGLGTACAELTGPNSCYLNNCIHSNKALAGARVGGGSVVSGNRIWDIIGDGLLLTTGRHTVLRNTIADCTGMCINLQAFTDFISTSVEKNVLAFYGVCGIGAGSGARRVIGQVKDNFIYSDAAGSTPLGASIATALQHCQTGISPFADLTKEARIANHYRLSAAAKGVATPLCDNQTDYSDAGAVQSQASAGGGLLVHGGMTGGIRG